MPASHETEGRRASSVSSARVHVSFFQGHLQDGSWRSRRAEAHAIHQRHGQSVAQGQLEEVLVVGARSNRQASSATPTSSTTSAALPKGEWPCVMATRAIARVATGPPLRRCFRFWTSKGRRRLPRLLDISVQGFTCVEEPCTVPVELRPNFGRHVGAFPHPCHHHISFRFKKGVTALTNDSSKPEAC